MKLEILKENILCKLCQQQQQQQQQQQNGNSDLQKGLCWLMS